MRFNAFSLLASCLLLSSTMIVRAQEQVVREIIVADTSLGTNLTFRPAASPTTQNVTLPATLPTVGTTYGVSAVSGANVTSSWLTVPSTVAKSTFKVQKTNATNASDATGVQFPDLSIDVLANKVYEVNAVIRFRTSAAGSDIEVQFEAPAGTTVRWYYNRISGTAGTSEDNGNYSANTWTAFASATPAAPGTGVFELRGVIISAGTPGPVRLLFRRQAGDPAATITAFAGSILRFTSN